MRVTLTARMESNKSLTIALHVLQAVSSRELPDQAELAALRNDNPSLGDLPTDTLACEVIQRILRERQAAARRHRNFKRAFAVRLEEARAEWKWRHPNVSAQLEAVIQGDGFNFEEQIEAARRAKG